MTRKVAIVGSAESTRSFAPYDDPTWEIWTLNDMYVLAPRIDRHFEIHHEAYMHGPNEKAELVWLREHCNDVEVWTLYDYDGITSRQYPIDAITKEFGSYLTNTISFMIALAIYEGVDELGVWGVDMNHGTEYAAQRPSCEYFLGIAKGRGITVLIPSASTLLNSKVIYGSEPDRFTSDIQSRIHTLQQARQQQLEVQKVAALNQAKADGGLELLQYLLITYGEV